MKITPLSVLFLMSFVYYGFSQSATDPESPFEAFEMADLEKQLDASGRLYLPFLKRSTLSTGLYSLKAGAIDPQQPHKQDEVYYVLEGKAQFTSGEETVTVQKGTVLFVAAQEKHHFHQIEEDLKVLVFFSAKEPK